MKQTLRIVAVIGLIALILYLGITKYLSEERAAKLDRALISAEARSIQLETDLEICKKQLADLTRNLASPTQSVSPLTATGTVAVVPSATPLRYATLSAMGVTNLVRIEGTSTIHDWQVEGHLIGGIAEFGPDFPAGPGAQAGAVTAKVSVYIPVRSLKSVEPDGRSYSDPMDEIMYGKLLEPDNKRITFALTSLRLKEPPRERPAPVLYEATGDLCVAGQTNRITMLVTVLPAAKDRIQFTGSVRVKMTDFKISPPSPSLAGVTITTGDEVTLRFVWWIRSLVTQ